MSTGAKEISDLVIGSLSYSFGNIACFSFSSAFIIHDAKEFILSVLKLFVSVFVYLCIWCVFESRPVKEGGRERVHCTLSQ